MSDTPRTDAAIDFSFIRFIGVNFCRGLERELSAKTAECAELRQLLTNKCNADAALWALSIDASNHEHQVALEKCHAADEEIYAAMGEKP